MTLSRTMNTAENQGAESRKVKMGNLKEVKRRCLVMIKINWIE